MNLDLPLPLLVLLLTTTVVAACFGLGRWCADLDRRGYSWVALALALTGAAAVAMTLVFSMVGVAR